MSDQSWSIEFLGESRPIYAESLSIGRNPDSSISLDNHRVSWSHARIDLRDGQPFITDLSSTNGTFVGDVQLGSTPRRLEAGAVIAIGDIQLKVVSGLSQPTVSSGRFRRIALNRQLRIGRADDNDIVLAEPNVSWHHARVDPGAPATIIDLGSRNGVRIGDEFVHGKAAFTESSEVGIGPYGLRLDHGALVVVDERDGMHMKADGVTVKVGNRTILNPTSIGITSGEMVAMIGPSGSGKSTLIKCLAGVVRPTGGRVSIDGSHLALRLTEVGYVPQSDVVHRELTLREALAFAARLRLPSDSRPEERATAVDDVIRDLKLEDHADTRVMNLSGGQRKRVACGIELIGKPTMLMLDEPTSGLDPALERLLMGTLRELADGGRGIVVVTHATTSLAMCDTVAVMGPGGSLLYAGAPEDALGHFGVSAYDDIYAVLDLHDEPPTAPEHGEAHAEKSPRARLLSGRSLRKQTVALTSRYGKTLFRDRRTMAVQLIQAPVIGLLIALLYPSNLLHLSDKPPSKIAQFVFLVVTASLWLGLIGSCREIAKERLIAMRELAVGVRLDAYLFSKTAILFVLTAIQVLAMLAVVLAIQPLFVPLASYVEFATLMILASWVAVGIGLTVSTIAKSVDQATSFIPLLLIPLLLFGGALVPRSEMQMPVKVLSDLTASRWAFASAGNVVDMEKRLSDDKLQSHRPGEIDFFSLEPVIGGVILLGLTAGMMLLTALLLAMRSGRPFDG